MSQLISLFNSDGLLELEANYPFSSYMENLGNGKFELKALPQITQYAPVNGIQTDDINDDGNADIILVGNDFGNEIISGRLDALNGVVLLGDGKGEFRSLTSMQSGFLVPGDAKALAFLRSGAKEMFIATQNRDSLLIFEKKLKSGQKLKIFKPQPSDSWGELSYKNGQTEKVEFYFGAGYLTQSTRSIALSANVSKLVIHAFDGKIRIIDLAAL
jgi:hypothetical protein